MRSQQVLGVQAQQFCGVAAEDCHLVVVTEVRRVEDELDWPFSSTDRENPFPP